MSRAYIKKCRMSLGLSQEEFARRLAFLTGLKIDRHRIISWEMGRVRVTGDVILVLCKVNGRYIEPDKVELPPVSA